MASTPDGVHKGVDVPICDRATFLFKQLALGRLKHLFARGGG
jgi:hypothetical protein